MFVKLVRSTTSTSSLPWKKSKIFYLTLPSSEIFSQVLDPYSVNPFFITSQLYSPEVTLTKEKFFSAIAGARKKPTDPLLKILVCDPVAAVEVCSPPV